MPQTTIICKSPISKPVGVPISVAACLLGQMTLTVRRRVTDGSIQILPRGTGRITVSIARLEQYAGRQFTVAEIEAATQRAREGQAARRAVLAAARAAKQLAVQS